MILIEGKYNTAKIFTDELESTAEQQIRSLCDQEFTKDLAIRIMPDVHAGAGCTIGTTMTIKDKVVPNLVGVDIGCGMETVKLRNKNIELQKLDKTIYKQIPAGFQVRNSFHKFTDEIDLDMLRCSKPAKINIDRAMKSLGTLGGGNHFIEAAKDKDGHLYIVIHSGSRHLGLETAVYYQNLAIEACREKTREPEGLPKALAYLSGGMMEDYIHDMKIIQRFAMLNRKAMMHDIIKEMKLKPEEEFTTIHNYIDTESMILRKGAVSAKEGERLLIPINMRDGSLICTGKGNADFNYSAPHGAGRLMSRKEAKNTFTVSAFKKEMKEVYTTSIHAGTLDECPMAYKSMEEIIRYIGDTAEVVDVITPVYNFKAGEE